MKMKHFSKAAAIFAFFAIFLTSSHALAQRGGGFGKGDPERMMSVLKERLSLTEEQEAKIRPIMTEQMEKRRALFEQYKGQGRESRGEMRTQMQEIRNDTETRLATILSAEQMAEFKKLQEERRNKAGGKRRNRG